MAEEVNSPQEELRKKFETKIFKRKKLEDLVEEVYTNSVTNQELILSVINKFNSLVDTEDDDALGKALHLAPHIGQYMKLNLDTNEQLIKLISGIQKFFDKESAKAKAPAEEDEAKKLGLTDADLKALEQLELEYKQLKVIPMPEVLDDNLPTKVPVKQKRING